MMLSPSGLSSEALSVKAFGAVGDGRTNDTAAIQAAIDAASRAGGGTVVLPPGAFVSGSIFLKDRITLFLDPASTLLGSRDRRDYPLVDGRWEGSTRGMHAALIHAAGATSVAVAGRGTVDGRGEEWWRLFRSGELETPRPRLIALEDCEDVLLEGFTARNSPSWTVNPVRSHNVRILGLTIVNPGDSPNTDGINPDSCSAVRISDCYVSVGDDCITIKAGSEHEAAERARPCEDVVVTNCVLERGHGGVVIGSETSGGVRNVSISNCVFKGTDRGIRMKSRRGRGGTVERIRVSNIVMSEVLCPFTMNLHYGCGAWGEEAVSDRGARPVDAGTPHFRDIAFNAISASDVRLAAAFIDGLAEAPVEDLSFTDVRVELGGEAEAAAPEMAEGLPRLSRAGFHASNVRGLHLNGLRVSGFRGPAYTLEGCEDLTASACSPALP